MRCLALAEAWEDAGGVASFATSEIPNALSRRIAAAGISQYALNSASGSSEDAASTIALALRLGCEWVVIDGDRFGSDFLETVRNAGVKVLLIDDFAVRASFSADLIVNPNLGVDVKAYGAKNPGVPVLAGTSFVMLRREFSQHSKCRGASGEGNRVLVTLGGSDPDELTPKIASTLASCPDFEVTAVVGAAYSNLDNLRKLESLNLRLVVDAQNMMELMTSSDMAIIAAGGTLWELLSTGCAVLSYSRNTVQAQVVRVLAKKGAVLDLGDTRSFDSESLLAATKALMRSATLREEMTNLGRVLVDGLGATRIVQIMWNSGAVQ